MKDKVILVGTHGKPSTREAFKDCNTGTLIQRRKFMRRGRRTGRLIQTLYYRHYTQEDKENYVKKKDLQSMKNSVVLRWGSQEPIETDGSTIVYNKIPALRNATDKGLARHIMAEAEVRVPKIVTPDNVQEDDYPIICRPHVHSKGRNFIVLNDEPSFLEHYDTSQYYYAAHVDKEEEFRVHAGHGKVIRLMKKQNPNNGNIAWNRAANGDAPGFEVVRWSESDPYKDVMYQALLAIEALGLDCGGVDVMLKDGKAYVLEVNTAPTLNSCPTTAKRWGYYWNWLLESDQRREHYDFKSWKKANSFFFKNFQLGIQPAE